MTQETVKTIYIGNTDIFEWTQGVGKEMLMPILLEGCERLLDDELDELPCAIINALVNNKAKDFEFSVQRKNIQDTISKIFEWSIQNEEYEMCQRIKELEERLNRF
tara:strand:- start:2771 stop:3088 length:318 start_codon:yes stop_codon:yes gene_type:complete